MPRSKSKKVTLKRPCVIAIGFMGDELERLKAMATRAGLSIAEFGRRKIFDIPVVDVLSYVVPPKKDPSPGRSARFTFRFSALELRELKSRARTINLAREEYARRKLLDLSLSPVEMPEPAPTEKSIA